MADPQAVKRALSRLAAGLPSMDGPPEQPPDAPRPGSLVDSTVERVVVEASEAILDLDRAAAFRHDGGFARLRRAVATAERSGNRDLARRGQRALAAFERFDRAAANGAATGDLPGTDLQTADSLADEALAVDLQTADDRPATLDAGNRAIACRSRNR